MFGTGLIQKAPSLVFRFTGRYSGFGPSRMSLRGLSLAGIVALTLAGPVGLLRLDSVVAQAYEESLASATQAWQSVAVLAGTEAAPISESEAPAEPPVILPAREIQLPATANRPAAALYVPEGPAVPRTALMVLHGMGGSGPGIAGRVLQQARERDWIVVAPTVPYGDWRDPNQLVNEELRLLPQLNTLLGAVEEEAGVSIRPRVMLFGFSRGAQAALRFTTLYPDRVESVVALSAGTYTLPLATIQTSAGTVRAPLPFGVADLDQHLGRVLDTAHLARVRFFIGVGGGDNRDGDVPRQWDPFVGKNRVERAERFSAVLQSLGCETRLAVIPGAGHEIVGPMVEQSVEFLTAAFAAARMEELARWFPSEG